MKKIKTKKFITNLIVGIMVFGMFFAIYPKTFALNDQQNIFVNSGQMNNVISDADFTNINSMSVDQIQGFLAGYNSYLAGYVDPSDGRSAARIIYDAAHANYHYMSDGILNNINISATTTGGTVSPEVILVYLQKEQSLVETPANQWSQSGLSWAMTASVGYQCFAGVSGDNNGNNCKDSTEGFAKQVEYGAWQLRYDYERAQNTGFSDFQVGQTFTTSDGYSVTFVNRATAAVYRYTPYVFNSSFNVWNIFYNRYNPLISILPPYVPPTADDTAQYSTATYAASVTISGAKVSTDQAFFNNNLIADVGSTSWQLVYSPPIGTIDTAVVFKDTGGNVLDQKPIHTERHKLGDINGDGKVDGADLAIFAANWGQTNPNNTWLLLNNNDNKVDGADLAIFAANWGN